LNGKVIRLNSWKEFKQLIIEHNPTSIAYNIEQGVPRRHLTGLRLILPVKGTQYVFIDTAVRPFDHLRKTGIPLHKDKYENKYIKDEDVVTFLRNELKRKDLKLHSYWTI